MIVRFVDVVVFLVFRELGYYMIVRFIDVVVFLVFRDFC